MIVESIGQGMVLPQEERIPGGHVALLRGKTAVFGVRCGISYCVCGRNSSVFHLLQAIAICDASGVKPELNEGWSGHLLCFLMKAGLALVIAMVVCWSQGGQGTTANKLSVAYRHTGPTPRVMIWGVIPPKKKKDNRNTLVVIPNTLTANLCVTLVFQPIVVLSMNRNQGRVF
ncbi:transposable element Tc1 transposase [Trichonephila clavipes]|nr:transposable element Tc1 transposase [Trichonephila clavipes]